MTRNFTLSLKHGAQALDDYIFSRKMQFVNNWKSTYLVSLQLIVLTILGTIMGVVYFTSHQDNIYLVFVPIGLSLLTGVEVVSLLELASVTKLTNFKLNIENATTSVKYDNYRIDLKSGSLTQITFEGKRYTLSWAGCVFNSTKIYKLPIKGNRTLFVVHEKPNFFLFNIPFVHGSVKTYLACLLLPHQGAFSSTAFICLSISSALFYFSQK
jgi:hypothetical protein